MYMIRGYTRVCVSPCRSRNTKHVLRVHFMKRGGRKHAVRVRVHAEFRVSSIPKTDRTAERS